MFCDLKSDKKNKKRMSSKLQVENFSVEVKKVLKY